MSDSGLFILTYHGFDSARSPLNTDPAWFADTIETLAEGGFAAIDLSEWLNAGRPPVGCAYAVTIDDGLASVRHVAPVIERNRLPITLFVVTDCVGRDNGWPGQPRWVPRARTLTWAELAELRSLGVHVGSHSCSHPNLARQPAPEIALELARSRDTIEQRLGSACDLFAYPYGIAPRLARQTARALYSGALGVRPGRCRSASDASLLPRFDAHDLRTPRALAALMDGSLRRRLGPWLLTRQLRLATQTWVG
jgi:peptidoglycan/xylan/chitin deacetylase (PgdA/CDA1 family)